MVHLSTNSQKGQLQMFLVFGPLEIFVETRPKAYSWPEASIKLILLTLFLQKKSLMFRLECLQTIL